MTREDKEVLRRTSLADFLKANGYREISDHYDGDYEHEWRRGNHHRRIIEWEE